MSSGSIDGAGGRHEDGIGAAQAEPGAVTLAALPCAHPAGCVIALVRIVGPTTGHVQPLGVVGEVRARGHSQMIGYFDDPGGTAAAVDAEGWLRTGDFGAMDEHGVITLAGRRAPA